MCHISSINRRPPIKYGYNHHHVVYVRLSCAACATRRGPRLRNRSKNVDIWLKWPRKHVQIPHIYTRCMFIVWFSVQEFVRCDLIRAHQGFLRAYMVAAECTRGKCVQMSQWFEIWIVSTKVRITWCSPAVSTKYIINKCPELIFWEVWKHKM